MTNEECIFLQHLLLLCVHVRWFQLILGEFFVGWVVDAFDGCHRHGTAAACLLGLRCSTFRIFLDRHPPDSAVPLNNHTILWLWLTRRSGWTALPLAYQILVLIATSSHRVHKFAGNSLRLVSMMCWTRSALRLATAGCCASCAVQALSSCCR